MSRTFEGLVEHAEAVERDYRARIAIYRILEEALVERGQNNEETGEYEAISIEDIPLKPGWLINLVNYVGEGQERFAHLRNSMGLSLIEALEITLWVPHGESIVPKDAGFRTMSAVTDHAKLTLVVAENGVMDNDTGKELFGKELEALLRDVERFFSNSDPSESQSN